MASEAVNQIDSKDNSTDENCEVNNYTKNNKNTKKITRRPKLS